LNTAIYVRVSTEEQAKEGYSIRAQIDKLKSYIMIKDWTFYKVYADEGISGKNITDRPAINELIADIKAGRVGNVFVYKIDRLTRSTRDLIDLTEIFKDHSCNFNSLMEARGDYLRRTVLCGAKQNGEDSKEIVYQKAESRSLF